MPPEADLAIIPLLQARTGASRMLAELKGRATAAPDAASLINTLALWDAKDSIWIESIVTTHDELFQADVKLSGPKMSPAAKEVGQYRAAIKLGYDRIYESKGLITTNTLIE